MIYRVSNKVFCMYFWTRADAEAFCYNIKVAPSSGIEIHEVGVHGENPWKAALQRVTQEATLSPEEYDRERLQTRLVHTLHNILTETEVDTTSHWEGPFLLDQEGVGT